VRILTRAIQPSGNPPADIPSTAGGNPDGIVFEPADTTPGPPLPPPRSFLQPWAGWPSGWQIPVGSAQVLTDTAWTCVDLNASILASMPPYLVDPADSLNTSWLINPDPLIYSSWEEFAKQLFWDFQLGEAFVLCTARYATGWPARFHVVPPWYVNAEMDSGRRVYTIGALDVTADMLHLRYKSSTDNARGIGPLDAGWTSVAAAQMWKDYAFGLVGSGGVPSSVLTTPEGLNKAQAEDLKAQWVQARQSSIGEPAVLSGGVTWEATQLDPEKMAMSDLQKFSESRIAVMLGVPPFLVGLPSGGDPMTYANVSAIFDYHWRAGLRPKVSAVMGGLSEWLLPAGTQIELNRDSYVQPDPLQRAQTWQIYQAMGVLSPDEIRRLERFDEILAITTTSALGGAA
jgi:HK97 family phage portal protein